MIYWQENITQDQKVDQKDVYDLSFKITCRELPADHAWDLSRALIEKLPWMKNEPQSAIQLIHISQSAHGWNRADTKDGKMQLSKRCRFRMRVPANRLKDAEKLTGKTVKITGQNLTFGKSKDYPLVGHNTLLSRYVIDENELDEESFIESTIAMLHERDIEIRKLLCGREHRFQTPDGSILTRSVLLADLEKNDSIMLQQKGFENDRLMGMGVFIPHKDIEEIGVSTGS